MPHTVTGRLNEDAREFQAGESTGFGFRLGERYYDRQTKTSEYTNYEGAIFSNNQQQIDFLRSALVKGSVVSVSCDQLKIDIYTNDQGTQYPKNQMQNCRLDSVYTQDAPQPSGNSGQLPPQQATPTTYSPQNPAGAINLPPMPAEWLNHKPTAKANGKTLQQCYEHDKVRGNLQVALQMGVVEPIGGDDDLPF